jgi:hypothetical protein
MCVQPTAAVLQNDVAIERHARVQPIQDVFARPPLFRVAAQSEDRAYALLNELALAMVEVDQNARSSRTS